MNAPQSVLVAQTIYLGDLVLTLPLLSALHRAYPGARIDALVHKGLAGVVEGHPAVTCVHSFDKEGIHRGMSGVVRLSRELRRYAYDVAIVLPGSLRTALVPFLAGIPVRIGGDSGTGLLMFEDMLTFPEEIRKSPGAFPILHIERLARALGRRRSVITSLFTDVVSLDRALPVAWRHLQLLAPLGIRADVRSPLEFSLAASQEDSDAVARLVGSHEGGSIIGLAPGSAWPTKRWPSANFVALAHGLVAAGKTVAIVGGDGDAVLASEIEAAVGKDAVINGCGTLSVRKTAELLRLCTVLVTNDSAPAHICRAVGTPCITLLGPTVREFGFAHDAFPNVTVETPGLECRPCTSHGGGQCPLGTHVCMTAISPERVLQTVLSFG
jgi:heptosyltransferase II